MVLKTKTPVFVIPLNPSRTKGFGVACYRNFLGKHRHKWDSWILLQSRGRTQITAGQRYLPLAPGQQGLSENASSPLSQSLLHLPGKGTVISVLSHKSASPVEIPSVGEQLY